MNVTIHKDKEITNVIVEGRLDTTTSPDFEKNIASLFTDTEQQIVINCSNLDFVSSSGLRILLSLQKQTNATNCNLKFRNLKPEVKAVFDMTGFSSILTIE